MNYWQAYRHLTALGLPKRFVIVQFPNLPLLIALITIGIGRLINGHDHPYLVITTYLALTIWAIGELIDGLNWFRRLLGLTYLVTVTMVIINLVHP